MWTKTSAGHEVALLNSKVVCRNAAGKQLRSVPAALKDDPVVIGLRQLADWLTRHETQCRSEVEAWMVRSLPIPVSVLIEVWPDPSWQEALKNLVISADGEADFGLLRDVDPAKGAGLVNLDGDSVWVKPPNITLPHPVLLPDLADLREFVTDLGVEQVVPQLFRETWVRPADADLAATAEQEWAGGRFQQLRHLTGRVISLGYAIRGGYATVQVFEDAVPIEARFWIGSDPPEYEAETGELCWVDARNRQLPLGEVGPVAWSEGARMAARIYAGRVVEEAQAA